MNNYRQETHQSMTAIIQACRFERDSHIENTGPSKQEKIRAKRHKILAAVKQRLEDASDKKRHL